MIVNGLKATSRVVAATNRQLIRSNHRGPICTAPRVRISFYEKVAHGVIMSVAFLAVPGYVVMNLKHWRPSKE